MISGRFATAIGAVLAVLMLCGAGPYTTRLSTQDLRHIRTIAVIPALGATFLFEHVSDRPYEWIGPPDSHFLEVSDWGLDAQIGRDVTTALSARFVVKPVAFVSANFSSWNDWLLKRATLDLNVDPAIDAYVLMLRDRCPDAIGYSVHELSGLGLYRRDGKRMRLGIFACYRIVVVDALTGDTIASHAARTATGTLPWISADKSAWPKTPNGLSAAQRTSLANAETSLINATLLKTLQQVNLVH